MAETPAKFPRRTLEQALRVPRALRDHNGGNPWATDQVAEAIGVGPRSGNFYYLTAASRDYGLTTGTRETAEISLTDLGRRVVSPQTPTDESEGLLAAFLNVGAFRAVLDHFGGSNLPERRFLQNTLEQQFNVAPSAYDEFVDVFMKNCRFLGIGGDFRSDARPQAGSVGPAQGSDETITVATPDGEGGSPICFVIMPFTERDERHESGFFAEVLTELFTPAGTQAGFTVKTALRQGSDVIQSTIVNDLLRADLVLADLTEHNPNVLFELGMRMKEDKPVALVRAKGTGPIFDVDNMLRVEEYNPNLWPSSLKRDLPRLTAHLKAAWEDRDSADTFMKILHRQQAA